MLSRSENPICCLISPDLNAKWWCSLCEHDHTTPHRAEQQQKSPEKDKNERKKKRLLRLLNIHRLASLLFTLACDSSRFIPFSCCFHLENMITFAMRTITHTQRETEKKFCWRKLCEICSHIVKDDKCQRYNNKS